ncbi:MAG: flavin reductase family protein [Candidatus Heimdallarchaeota archaeon]
MKLLSKIIFAIPSDGSEQDLVILVESIREFGGQFSKNEIWVFVPKSSKKITAEWAAKLEALDAQVVTFDIDPDELLIPFGRFVREAAKAESMAQGKTEFLVWLDHNCLIISEPKEFLLKENESLGYRPVHHTLIGSQYNQPLDSFWELMYEKCYVTDDKVFSMKTHVDGKTLRPYINSGFLVVRPEKNLLNEWATLYFKLFPDFKQYCVKNDLYAIFTHQAVLSSLILTKFERNELKELPFDYNYPIHLYSESSDEFKPKSISDMTTARFYLQKLLDPKLKEQIPFDEPLKSWLNEKLTSIKSIQKQTLSKKVKFGQVPLVYPIPIVLAGSLVNGKPNFEELGDVAVMGINPAIIVISSGKDHYTNKGIIEHNTFSINFPTTKMIAITDYCGFVSGNKVDKSELFDVFYGDLETAPMIKDCPVNLECKVIKEFSIQHRQIFVAEVAEAYVNEEFVTETDGRKKIADMRKLDPIIYALDNKYYNIGEPIGEGYKECKELRDKFNSTKTK